MSATDDQNVKLVSSDNVEIVTRKYRTRSSSFVAAAAHTH